MNTEQLTVIPASVTCASWGLVGGFSVCNFVNLIGTCEVPSGVKAHTLPGTGSFILWR